MSPDSANWRADRLTLTARRDAAGIRRCQSRSWWHAVSRTQRPIGRMRPVSSASGMNDERRHDAARRVLPAQQCLHAQHGARGRGRPAAGSGAAAPSARSPAAGRARASPGRWSGRASRGRTATVVRTGSAFARWSAISACLSRSNGCGSVALPTAMPDAGADGQLGAVEVERVREGGLDPRRHALGLAHAADRPQQDPELVGAEAGHGVRGAGGRDQALARPARAAGRRPRGPGSR